MIVSAAFLLFWAPQVAEPSLKFSVYATAGDVSRYLLDTAQRGRAEAAMQRLKISRIFLEGRRGDEYVAPAQLRMLRQYIAGRGIEVTGGIATVPGKVFGTRQNEKLGWLNWESGQTQKDIANFFRENAAVFDQLIVDDFYCTGDTSPASEKARGARSWGDYRQDLMAGLVDPLIVQPTRQVNPRARLILKYPQWYDRFHMFGYNPQRLSGPFEQIWVGTEVRNPLTQRMGFVQPTQGYMNFRWISSVVGTKVVGAWFDHIESTGQNVVDQAYQSVLAGARELTYFHLGDLVEGHPSHPMIEAAIPELTELAGRVAGRQPSGVAYYKPVASGSDGNMYLMDYLGMLGLPVVPVAAYPSQARVVVLGIQAAADPKLLASVEQHLKAGATVVVTPALLRTAGSAFEQLAGVKAGAEPQPGLATAVEFDNLYFPTAPLEIDRAVTITDAKVVAQAVEGDVRQPLLTMRAVGTGQVLLWNLRTFTEQDFQKTGEWLLAPQPLGLPHLARPVIDMIRKRLGVPLSAPPGVGLYHLGSDAFFYNFQNHDVSVVFQGRPLQIGANRLLRIAGRIQ
jgi:hypothetical protein